MLSKPKLTVELVPSTSWGDNLRTRLAGPDWDRLRKACYKAAGYRCEICGMTCESRPWPVECHEIWSYSDITHTQKLEGLIALCDRCHEVKHAGFAQVRGRLNSVYAKLCAVNGWSVQEAQYYVKESFRVWEARSEHGWKLDLSWLKTVGVAVPREK